MKTIVINAYACAPDRGSEPGMAWNWVINLANYCRVHVITEGEWQKEIEVAIQKLSQKDNITFYFNPVTDEIRTMCWNQGDWRFYKYYRLWQKSTLAIAKDIIKKERVDIVHQLNMIGFREPGYLWEIEGIPFVWGPVDAKEKFPVAYMEGGSLKAKLFIRLKNFITVQQLKYAPRVRKAFKKAAAVVSASSNSVATIKKYFNYNSVLINETGCYVNTVPVVSKTDKPVLDLLWVGKFDFRKQLALALKTITKVKDIDVKLHIVGGDETESVPYKQQADELGITNNCVWHGKVPHSKVQELMANADLFFFTSVAEGTPHVVLEAISNNLPVLCFNTCGQGDSVNEKVGFKIELSNPGHSQNEFAAAIRLFYTDRNLLADMSQNCAVRKEELSWDNKARQMLEVYNATS